MSFLAEVVAGLVASAISALLGHFFSDGRLRLPKFLGSFPLTEARTTAAGILGITLSAGIGLSTSDHSHRVLSYVLWYGTALSALVVVVVCTVLDGRRSSSKAPGGSSVAPPSPSLPMSRRQEGILAATPPSSTDAMRRRAAAQAIDATRREKEQHDRLKAEIKRELVEDSADVPPTNGPISVKRGLYERVAEGDALRHARLAAATTPPTDETDMELPNDQLPPTSDKLADVLARLHEQGRAIRHRVKPEDPTPIEMLSIVGKIFRYPHVEKRLEDEARRWGEQVRNQLALHAPRFTLDWEKCPKLPHPPIITLQIASDGPKLVAFMDARLGLLENIIDEVRGSTRAADGPVA